MENLKALELQGFGKVRGCAGLKCISCRRGNSCWDEQWSVTMRSEEASSQPQQPVKFPSFRSSNRLMNSDATGGRDLVSFQCKIGQRLHK